MTAAIQATSSGSERQLRALNAERQRQLVTDTNKLLKLARELDAEIGSTNPDSLTSDQIRRDRGDRKAGPTA